MKIIIDRDTIRRRANLAHAASLGGLLALLGSVGISMYKPELNVLSAVILFVGGSVSMLGIYYANRWVKKPRPEDILDQALKGLNDQHRLYHYTRLGNHLLLTPNGVVVLETVNLEGRFTYQDGRWQQKLSMGRALRYIVEEKLGNPTTMAQQQVESLSSYLKEGLPQGTRVPTQALIVFTHPLAELKIDKSPIPVVQPDKLSRKVPHPEKKLSPDIYQHLRQRLDALLPETVNN
jgi:hypothetical protein